MPGLVAQRAAAHCSTPASASQINHAPSDFRSWSKRDIARDENEGRFEPGADVFALVRLKPVYEFTA